MCYNTNIHNLFILRWCFIKKLHPDKKKFLDKRSRKYQRRKYKYNKKERRNISNKPQYTRNKKEKFKTSVLMATAPKDFRIINNTSEVLLYFKSIIDIIKRKRNKIKISINLKDVEYITVDTVMYMLAILRNLKEKVYRNITFSGNSPINSSAKKIFEESGFLNYVRNRNTSITPNSRKIQIKSGKTVDPSVPKEICDIVNKICTTDKKFTFDLYAVLVELINNTIQHAYSKESVFLVSEWYLFAEENETDIQFVFLDTGEGIPSTVHKKVTEKLLTINDSMYIQTALEGKHRTQTRQFNRGEGLPRVVEAYTKGNLVDLMVYSGKGSCKVLTEDEGLFSCQDYSEQLYGTLFVWKIKKPI